MSNKFGWNNSVGAHPPFLNLTFSFSFGTAAPAHKFGPLPRSTSNNDKKITSPRTYYTALILERTPNINGARSVNVSSCDHLVK